MAPASFIRHYFPKKLMAVGFCLLIVAGCKSPSSTDQSNTERSLFDNAIACEDGLADNLYPCSNVDLLAHLTPEQLQGSRLNDIWGWKDPETGVEYALVGMRDGVTFVDLTSSKEPVVVGKLAETTSDHSSPGKSMSFIPPQGAGRADEGDKEESTWRDFKVYKHYLYVVSDGQDHGMQVFDLSRLSEVPESDMPKEFQEDASYDSIDNAHNIFINKKTAYAFAVGATSGEICSGGGLHMIDISSPTNPEFAGCYSAASDGGGSGPGYVHDTQCVVYRGPDADYSGREVCFNASGSALVIADVQDKLTPQTVSISTYEGAQYVHQGWLTEDQSYFISNDELDESRNGTNTRTYIWNVRDLDNPEFLGFYEFPTRNIDHNLYVKGNYVYEANYTNGLRILALDEVSNGNLEEVAYFDTYTDDDAQKFDGAWSTYPFFESGMVIVSDMSKGLFILHPQLN